MDDDDPGIIHVPRRTVGRAGIVVAMFVAIGIGFAIGWLVFHPATTQARTGQATGTVTEPVHNAIVPRRLRTNTTTTTAPMATTILAAPPASIAPCSGNASQPARPTLLYIGCATSNSTVTTITWSRWGASGAYGMGTYNVNNCQPDCAGGKYTSVPAAIVVSDPLGGVFQDITVTPMSGGPLGVSSNDPGSGWGSD